WRGGKMLSKVPEFFSMRQVAAAVSSVVLLACAATVDARVTKIVVETRTSPAFAGATYGTAGQYETLAGRGYGELDPNDPHHTIINDLPLEPTNTKGMGEYSATFFLVKPIDMARSSHLMWQDVPNRGGR